MTDDEKRLEMIIVDLRNQNADLRGALLEIGSTPMASKEAMEAEFSEAGWEEIQRLKAIANDVLRVRY